MNIMSTQTSKKHRKLGTLVLSALLAASIGGLAAAPARADNDEAIALGLARTGRAVARSRRSAPDGPRARAGARRDDPRRPSYLPRSERVARPFAPTERAIPALSCRFAAGPAST